MDRMRAAFVAILAASSCGAMPVSAQNTPPPPAAPPPIDPSTIPMPDLAFTPTREMEGNYDKYFYFHRAETDFATAYADLQECDGYARGLAYRTVGGVAAGALGGVLGDAISDGIYGSAERRRIRRVNMRTCMGFKGYKAYGLPESVWERFNFEEGNRRVEEGRRQLLLQMQARAASGPEPRLGEIEE